MSTKCNFKVFRTVAITIQHIGI